MDEFRKPFEYDEEKRGILLLFFIGMILSIDVLSAISLIVQVYGVLKYIPILAVSFIIIGTLFILFILFTIIICYKLTKDMVSITKTYLILRAVFMSCSLFIVYLNSVNDKSMIGNGVRQFKSVSDLTFTVFLAPLAYVLVFSAGWYLYFVKSKKYKELS